MHRGRAEGACIADSSKTVAVLSSLCKTKHGKLLKDFYFKFLILRIFSILTKVRFLRPVVFHIHIVAFSCHTNK